MQVELQTAIIIGAQVAATATLSYMVRQVTRRMDKQNGRIEELMRDRVVHLKEFHSKK